MLDGQGLFFDGQNDFPSRTDIGAADNELARAFADIRAQIDTEFGNQDWQNLTGGANGEYPTCLSDGHTGYYVARDEGLTFGIDDQSFPRILEIVSERAASIGYTDVVDSSDDAWFTIDIFNTADGGYIHLTKARGKGLIFQVNSGCRPPAA